MKSLFLVILVIAWDGALWAAPKIVAATESPALRLENLRIDRRDGNVRGVAYLNPGYAAPYRVHIDLYGSDASGRAIYTVVTSLVETCWRLIPDSGEVGTPFRYTSRRI